MIFWTIFVCSKCYFDIDIEVSLVSFRSPSSSLYVSLMFHFPILFQGSTWQPPMSSSFLTATGIHRWTGRRRIDATALVKRKRWREIHFISTLSISFYIINLARSNAFNYFILKISLSWLFLNETETYLDCLGCRCMFIV